MFENNHYLHYLSLNFKNKKDQENYDKETKFRTILFIRFFLFYIVLISFLSCLVDLYTMNFFKKITSILITCLFAVSLSLILENHLFQKRIFFNIILGFLICLENTIQSEIFLPPLIETIQTNSNRVHHFWSIILIGMIMEMKMIILYVSNVKWFLVVLFNVCFHVPMFVNSFYNEEREKIIILTDIILMIQSLILSVFTSYLKEKSLKEIFLSLKRAQENLSMFEKLIEDAIPSQIIILSYEKPEIIYKNSKTKEFFQNYDDENSLFAKLEDIKIINPDNFETNLIEIYDKIIKDESYFFPENTKYDFKAFEGSYPVKENSFKDLKDQANFIFFDIKIGKITWKNQPAILILFNDISYKTKIKNLVVVNDYKDKLLATISHDLRSPLSAINGFFEILKERITEKKCLKFISAGLKSTKMLFFMINDLLDYSQISSHKLRLDLKEFQVEDILEDVLSIVKFQAKQKGLQFDHSISKSLLKTQLYGDPLRVQQILLNLIGNAIKFTLQGFVRLVIVAQHCFDHQFIHEKAVFQIIDSGIGIKDENLKIIFDPFYKIDENSFNLNRTGIGLGLVISQNLARMMHEEGINVSSKHGKGSIFEFSIPIAHSESIDGSLEEKSNVNLSKMSTYDFDYSYNRSMKSLKNLNIQKNINILIVDDDPLNILVHKNYLKTFGLKYETASNGLEAISKIEKLANYKKFFSLVIMDCNMPFMDGFEAAEKMQTLISHNIIPKTPIIAVTADICLNTFQKCEKFGILHCLTKPVSKKKLMEKLNEVLCIELYY